MIFYKFGVNFLQVWGEFSTDMGRFINIFQKIRDIFNRYGGGGISTNRNILSVRLFRQFFPLLSANQNTILCNYLIFN